MFVSPHTNLLFKTILLLEERNGIIWFLMKLKILKTSDHRDGRHFFDLTPNEDFY